MDIYRNVIIFATKYRGYTIKSDTLCEKKFKETMQIDHYIRIDCEDSSSNICILIMKHDSKYMHASQKFKQLLYSINTNEVIIITYKPPTVYIKKAIDEDKHIIHNYYYKHFVIEVPIGPLCPRHTIMSNEDAEALLKELNLTYDAFPVILTNDPQCIWLGAKAGQLIQIDALSEIAGKAVRYRICRDPVFIENPDQQL